MNVALEATRLLIGGNDLLRRTGAASLPRVIRRVLGVRQAAQAVLTLRSGCRAAHALGGAVDAAHAVSMIALCAVSGRYRIAALVQVLIASAFAIAESSAAARADVSSGAA